MRERRIPWPSRVAAAVIEASPDWSTTAVSRLMGSAARIRLPRPLSRAAVAAYARYYGVEMQDVDPLRLEEGFESFDAFFTRSLRRGARYVDRRSGVVVAPCDGTLRDIVRVTADTSVVAKDHEYTLGELLADEALVDKFTGGCLATIYLHPRDYHRVHAPTDALVHSVTLIPGRLMPVNDAAVSRQPRLFALNERMVHVLETGMGYVAVVMIAAFGVGHMSCAYHRFEVHPRELQIHECQPPVRVRKGDELGVFHLGSTVLLITEPGLQPLGDCEPGKIRFGQGMFEERGAR